MTMTLIFVFLKAKQRGQIFDLRRMYCHEILTSSINENRDKVVKKAWDYMTDQKRKKMLGASERGKRAYTRRGLNAYATRKSNIRKKKY